MTHSRLPNFSRLVSGGAEEAGMKGWRGRSRIPPEGAKARFTRVSRGLAPQVYRQDNPHSCWCVAQPSWQEVFRVLIPQQVQHARHPG